MHPKPPVEPEHIITDHIRTAFKRALPLKDNGLFSQVGSYFIPNIKKQFCTDLTFPAPAQCYEITFANSPILYGAYKEMLKVMGFTSENAPNLLVAGFKDNYSKMNDNAFFIPNLWDTKPIDPNALPETDFTQGRGAVMLGKNYAFIHTLETMLDTICHELGHVQQYREDAKKYGMDGYDASFRKFLLTGEMPPPYGKEIFPAEALAQSRMRELDADARAIPVMGAKVQEERHRRDGQFFSPNLTMHPAETKDELNPKKQITHPHTKQRIAQARELGDTQSPLRFIKRDGSVVER